jgi:prepilin-type processing-associated H-X9-DG protein
MEGDKKEPRWFLYLCLVILFIVVISIPTLLVMNLFSTTAHPPGAACAYNLSQLYKAMHMYIQAYGNREYYPPHVGQQFWFCLAGKCNDNKAHPASYFEKAPLFGNVYLFLCPRMNSPEGDIDYIGPRKLTPEGSPSALADGLPKDTPIAADKKGNHKDRGNVLFFDGRVQFLTGEEYEKALKELE